MIKSFSITDRTLNTLKLLAEYHDLSMSGVLQKLVKEENDRILYEDKTKEEVK